jgi:hypothetical protein
MRLWPDASSQGVGTQSTRRIVLSGSPLHHGEKGCAFGEIRDFRARSASKCVGRCPAMECAYGEIRDFRARSASKCVGRCPAMECAYGEIRDFRARSASKCVGRCPAMGMRAYGEIRDFRARSASKCVGRCPAMECASCRRRRCSPSLPVLRLFPFSLRVLRSNAANRP